MYQKVFFTWVGSVAEETHGDHMEIPLGYAGVSQTNANYPSEFFFVALFFTAIKSFGSFFDASSAF